MKVRKKKKTKTTCYNYKDALNEAFASLYGGGSPVQGLTNRNSKGFSVGSRSAHPYRSMTGPTGYDIEQIRAEEEQTSRAPALMPYPLDAIFDHVSMSLESLEQINILLKTAIENNSMLPEEKLGRLQKIQKYIESTIKNIVNIGKNIEKINLDSI
jgi:hypothetical protein